MTYRLYGDLGSGAFSAEAALAEIGAPYAFEPVLLEKNEQKEPRFLSINPSGKIPALRLPEVRLPAGIDSFYTPLVRRPPGEQQAMEDDITDDERDAGLRDMERVDIERAVLDGDVDIGVVLLSNIEKLSRFGSQVLIRSRRQLWVAPTHPLAQVGAPSLKDIAAHPYILITVDEGEQSTLRYWKKKGLEPNIAFRTSSMEALRGLVAHGFGVTVLSDMVFRPWSLEGNRIEARPVLDTVPQMDAGMIWQKGAQLNGPATALQQFLIHACGT